MVHSPPSRRKLVSDRSSLRTHSATSGGQGHAWQRWQAIATARAVLSAGSILACTGGSGDVTPVQPPSPPPPTSVVTSVQIPAIAIDSGSTVPVTATIEYSGNSQPTTIASWAVSDSSLASVTSTGQLTASVRGRRSGMTVLFVRIASQSSSVSLSVRGDQRVVAASSLMFGAQFSDVPGIPANPEVLLLRAGKDSIENRTFSPNAEFPVFWGVGGTSLFFARSMDLRRENCNVFSNCALFSTPRDGGTPRLIVRLGESLGRSTFVALHRQAQKIHLLRFNTIDEQEGMFTLNEDGSELSRLSTADNLSSQGSEDFVFANVPTKVAFVTLGAIRIADFGSIAAPRSYSIPCVFYCERLSWSPDDSKLAFYSDGALRTLDLSTLRVQRLADSDDRDLPAEWSPNGLEIAYGNAGALRAVNVTSLASTLLDGQIFGRSSIRWSPDGALIAYVGEGVERGITTLRLVRRSDRVIRRVSPAQSTVTASYFHWAPP